MQGTKNAAQPFVFSHQGDNPVDIMLVGCVYGTGEPVLQKESGRHFHPRQRFLEGPALAHRVVGGGKSEDRRRAGSPARAGRTGPGIPAATTERRELNRKEKHMPHQFRLLQNMDMRNMITLRTCLRWIT